MTRLRAEDLVVGDVYDLGEDALTEAEIVEFARAWDPQDFHVAADSAAAERFGGVIASGIQTMGLFMRLAAPVYNTWDVVAGRAIREAEFLKPVRAGMALHGTLAIVGVTPYSPARADVTHRGVLADRGGDGVLTMVLDAVVLRRPETDGAR